MSEQEFEIDELTEVLSKLDALEKASKRYGMTYHRKLTSNLTEDERKAMYKSRYDANPGKWKAYHEKFRTEHREEWLAIQRKSRAKNPEAIKISRKKHYDNRTPEQVVIKLAKQREYYLKRKAKREAEQNGNI